jgi:acid stress-induced BolA-like protein IbaG/YrbA
MAVARKLKKILEQTFPAPDKVELRDEDGIIGIVTSKRFRRIDTMQRQNLIHDLLFTHLTKEEQRQVTIIVVVTPEEAIAYSEDD